MTADLSMRARAILEAAERAAAAQGEPGDGASAAHGGPGDGAAAHGGPGDGAAAQGEPGGGAAAHGGPGDGAAVAPGGPDGGAATAQEPALSAQSPVASDLTSPPPAPQPHAPRQDWSRPPDSAPIPATPPGQLLAIVDQVMSAAEAARRRLDELTVTLDELTRRVDAAGRSAAQPTPSAPAIPPADTPLRARPRPPAGGATTARGAATAAGSTAPAGGATTARGAATAAGSTAAADGAVAATAKLIAVEMAVAGASRLEVDRRLRDQLGMPTTHEVLDEVFGAGSPPSARLS